MCLNCNNNTTVAPVKDATAMTRVSTSGQCTYLYKVRRLTKDTLSCSIEFQSTYLYKVRHSRFQGDQVSKSFNPRTYIRYDCSFTSSSPGFSLFQSTYLYKVRLFQARFKFVEKSFNPRTYIRYDTAYGGYL